MNQIQNVCVYSASSTKIAPAYFAIAEELGRLLAIRGINLINGAGSIGLMAATSNAALAAGGTVTGVIPRFMVLQLNSLFFVFYFSFLNSGQSYEIDL